MSSILPRACTFRPCRAARSRSVSPDGGTVKSFRRCVRWYFPFAPTKGRAMTRPTWCGGFEDLARDPAPRVQRLDRNDVLVRGDLEDGVAGRVEDGPARPHVLVAELLEDRRPGRGLVPQHLPSRSPSRTARRPREESRRDRAGKATSSVSPISSQCPVVVSFPAEASARRPNAPDGRGQAGGRVARTSCAGGRGASGSGGAACRRAGRAGGSSCPRPRKARRPGAVPTPRPSQTTTMTRRFTARYRLASFCCASVRRGESGKSVTRRW